MSSWTARYGAGWHTPWPAQRGDHVTDVLVVGEALMDVLDAGGTQVRRPGGSPANVAVGLARLGISTPWHA